MAQAPPVPAAACRRVAFADRGQIIPSTARSAASSPSETASSSSYFTSKLLRPRLFGALAVGSSSSSASLSATSAPAATAGASRTLDATLSPRAEAAAAFSKPKKHGHSRSASASSVPSTSTFLSGTPSSPSARRTAPSAHRAVSSSQLRETKQGRPQVVRRTSLTLGLPWKKGRRGSGTSATAAAEKGGRVEMRERLRDEDVQAQQRRRTSTADSVELPSALSRNERRLASASTSSESSALGIFLPPAVTEAPAPCVHAAAQHASATPSDVYPSSAHASSSDAPALALCDASPDAHATSAVAEEEADFAELLASSSPSAGIFLDASSDLPSSPALSPLPMPAAAAMLRTGSAVRPTAVRKPLALGREEESIDALPSPIAPTPRAEEAAPRQIQTPQPQAQQTQPQQPVEKTLRVPPMRPGHGEEVVSGTCVCDDCEALLLLGLKDDYHAHWSRGARRKYLADRAQRRMLARQSLSAAQQLAGEDVPHSAGASIASASLDSPAMRMEALPKGTQAAPEDGAAKAALAAAQRTEKEAEEEKAETDAHVPCTPGLLDAARLKTDEASSRATPARPTPLVTTPSAQALLLQELSLQRTSSSSSDNSGTELDDELLAEILAEASVRPLPPSLPCSPTSAFGLARGPSPGAGAQRMGARAMLRQLEAAEREEEKASACRRHEEQVRKMGAAVAEGLCRPWTPPVRIGSPEAARQRNGSPLHLSIPATSTSPPPARVPSPGLLSGLRAPSPLHSRTPSPLGLAVPEGMPHPSRTPSPRLVLPSSPPLRAASPHQAFHALIAAPDVPHLLAISERDAPDEEEEQVLPPLSAIQRRPSPRPTLQGGTIARLQSPPPMTTTTTTPPPLRPASPPVISAATRAAADRLPLQPQLQTQGLTLQRPSMQSRHSSSSSVDTRRRSSMGSSGAHGAAAPTASTASMSSSSSAGGGGASAGFFAAMAPAAGLGVGSVGVSSTRPTPHHHATSSSPASSPDEERKPQLQQRRTSASSSGTGTSKRKSTDGLRGLVARLRQ